jgi:hypothetical protein
MLTYILYLYTYCISVKQQGYCQLLFVGCQEIGVHFKREYSNVLDDLKRMSPGTRQEIPVSS